LPVVKEFGELSMKLEFGGFDDMGDISGAKGKTDRLCRKPIKAEEGRRTWKM